MPRNILIFLPNWVGDVAMATPALRALRRHFAQARITHIGRKLSLETLRGNDWADATMVERSNQRPALAGFAATSLAIRAGKFDLAVLLPNSFRSAVLARMSGGIKRVVGYDRDGRGCLLSDKLAPPRGDDGKLSIVPAIVYYNAIATHLGAPDPGWTMELPVSPDDQSAADAMLRDAGRDADVSSACVEGILPASESSRHEQREQRQDADKMSATREAKMASTHAGGTPATHPLVMLNPGASFGPSKLWPAERFAAVADELIARRGAAVIINAAPAEKPVALAVAAAMRHRPLINLAERENSIGLVKALLRRCDLAITNDTGARHLAVAMGAAVVTVFGSTDPARTELHYDRERIIRADVPCGPCQKKQCPLPVGAEFHQCMTAISPSTVLAAAEELLAATARTRPEARP
jgi:heptosyltransferase-2